jgi:UDP-N-acetyl-D-mannosaminuronic acid dehydrogenase
MNEITLSVYGLGRAGMPLACVAADSGIKVIGLDIDKNKLETIRKGKAPFPGEPGMQELIQKHIGKNLEVTHDYAQAVKNSTAHVVIVPLFIDENHNPDYSIIDSVFTEVGKYLKKDDLVILETTVPIGTTETRIKDILEKNSGMKASEDFYLAYSPERIMTGYSISRYKEFPKIVGGIDEKSTELCYKLYSEICNEVMMVTDAKTAEMTKVMEGVYRDVNLALGNEIYKLCQDYDVDFFEMQKASKHKFSNIIGPGLVGGHCIPLYPWFIIKDKTAPLIEFARKYNDQMVHYFKEKAKKIAGDGKKIGVVGLSYRENVKDTTHTLSKTLIESLKGEGYEVYGADPVFTEEEITESFDVKLLDDFEEMDAIILVTKITEFNDELNKIKEKVVDIRNTLNN